MRIINRDIYINKIKPYVGKELIKVLVGARRSGKTYILYQLIDFIKKNNDKANIIFISKEQYEFKSIRNDTDLYKFVVSKTIEGKRNFVFIDEIQEIDKFEVALRELLMKNYDIYCTGSNAKLLSSELATYLSGRYMEFNINSLSFSEFMLFHNLPENNDTLLKYIKYGGLPYLINLEFEDEIIYGYLRNVYNSIILKDVVARYNIRDVDFLDRLIEYLSDSLGNLISAKKIGDFLKTQKITLSVNTIQNYLQYLCNSFFVDKVKRYDIQGKKIFEINDKYYFRDLGLKHAFFPYQAMDINKVLENLVYNHFLQKDYKINIGKLDNKEIDFVVRKGDEIIYVQVAYKMQDHKTTEREFNNLLLINDNYRKIVISTDEFFIGNYKGIEHKHIIKFLTE